MFGNVSVCTPLWVFPDLKMAAQSMNVVGVSRIMPVLASVGEEKKSCYFDTIKKGFLKITLLFPYCFETKIWVVIDLLEIQTDYNTQMG